MKNPLISIQKCLLILSLIGLAGCAAVATNVGHKDLNVQTKMTNSVFLTPTAQTNHTVLIQYQDTSGQNVDLQPRIAAALAAKGYQVVTDPSKAYFWLQVNVLQISNKNPTAAQSSGFGMGGLGGAVAGGAVGALATGNNTGLVAGAIIGGIADTIASNASHNTTFTVITDVQIAQYSAQPINHNGVTVQSSTQNTTQGDVQLNNNSSTQTTISNANTVAQYDANRVYYKTRIISTANQANLKLSDALPALEQGLVAAISGIFSS